MDKAHIATEKALNNLEKELEHLYKQCYKKAKNELQANIKLLEKKDTIAVRKEIKRLENTLKSLTVELHNTDLIAAEMMQQELKEVADINVEFASNLINDKMKKLGVNRTYTLYNRETIKRILEGDVFKELAIEGFTNKTFIYDTLKRNLAQSLVLGESIDKIAKRIQNVINSSKERATTIARTETTKAQNTGRDDVFKAARENYGIKMKKQWIATGDKRTRISHRDLDGQVQEFKDDFTNGMDFPGANGPANEVVNCRCTFIALLEGVDY